jgi:outer membrane protein TolC
LTGTNETEAAAMNWRSFMAEPRLALASNLDLRIAAFNVEQSRAQHRVTRSAWPSPTQKCISPWS